MQVEELKNLNITKDKFFSIIAHDLKGPINGLIGLSDLLLEDFDDLPQEKIKEMHQLIKDTSEKGLKLLLNLLEWARIQTGRIQFSPSKQSINRLAEEIFNFLEANARLKSINLINDLPQEYSADCDYNMINTVLRNLVNNAIKFTYNDGEVRVSALQENGFLIVKVKDNGMGIKPEHIQKLFKLDEQVTGEGTNKEKGTGLGLILCKEYVQMHGGEIWVESDLGKGSCFAFSLPIKTA